MEFGPRALGARSILGDPRQSQTQSVMNLKIKYRESFRPFAPSVLVEDVGTYFDLQRGKPLHAAGGGCGWSVRDPAAPAQSAGLKGLDKLPVHRSEVPAITHVDYSARVQTVDRARHGRNCKLIKAFEGKPGARSSSRRVSMCGASR